MIDLLNALTGNAKFAKITYRAKESGELAVHFTNLQVNVSELYTHDLTALQALNLDGVDKEAADEIRVSRQNSLQKGVGNNDAYTCKDTYVHVDGMKGVKVHKDTGVLYITGQVEVKKVLEAGTYKVVNSKPKTIAKRKIEKGLPSAGFRTFILKNIKSVKVLEDVVEIVAD